MWDVTPEVAEILLIGYISTHTSRVGCDEQYFEDEELNKFLLTHPVWDVTIGP